MLLPGIRCDVDSMQSTPVPAELTASWQTTLEHWTQKAAHDTLLGLAAKHGQLAWLAARYRDAARSNPRDPIARDRLKGVQRAAAMLAFAMPAARTSERKKTRGPTMLLLAAALSTGLAIWLTDFMRAHHPTTTLVSRHP
jgi:hypothetical protein